ncbi:hypothetical protein BCV69DRAFT_24234 [Microstroma glucosiphilum]|uniref:Uncharacterized protein n=1 Tax=Pseudomicrostroma glucosiphilum TaxID=1684307 RepID=A0A316UGB0_9BASI|nr:hypothetical protein BCV69DRAFT_24234 [Pseudomicrostroma glucosiphilum]PWN24240.1 hypothetical protein BCV69DRAFT_24234 [Pseudomicrostroma glucosiphilum]
MTPLGKSLVWLKNEAPPPPAPVTVSRLCSSLLVSPGAQLFFLALLIRQAEPRAEMKGDVFPCSPRHGGNSPVVTFDRLSRGPTSSIKTPNSKNIGRGRDSASSVGNEPTQGTIF